MFNRITSWPDALNLISILVYFRVIRTSLWRTMFVNYYYQPLLPIVRYFDHYSLEKVISILFEYGTVIKKNSNFCNYLQRTKFTKHYDLKQFLNQRSLEQTSFTSSSTDPQPIVVLHRLYLVQPAFVIKYCNHYANNALFTAGA